MDLDSAVKNSAEAISTGFSDAVGDNRLALQLLDVQNEKVMPDVNQLGTQGEGRYTINETLNQVIGEVGFQAREQEDLLSAQEAVMEQLEGYRQSISGVSLEEEAINLMQFQTAFNASAKAIKMGDELLETVLRLKD